MRNKKLVIFLCISLVIVSAIVAVVFLLQPAEDPIPQTVFGCVSVEEARQYAQSKRIAYVESENELHIYGLDLFGYETYCVVSHVGNPEIVSMVECFVLFEDTEELSTRMEKVKKETLEIASVDGDYEYVYFPLDDGSKEVGEKEFLAGEASQELIFSDGTNLWNVSWYIVDEGVTAKISKSIG